MKTVSATLVISFLALLLGAPRLASAQPAPAGPSSEPDATTPEQDEPAVVAPSPLRRAPARPRPVLQPASPVPVLAPDLRVFEAPAAPPSPPRKFAQRYVGLELGARALIVGNAGFDPYAEDDLLASVSLGATWEPLRVAPIYIGFAGEYDYGSRSARARGVPSSLAVHRVAVGARVRWEAAHWLSLYAKASPGVLHLRGSLDDAVLDRPLVARTWTYTVDTLAGAAFPVATFGDREWPFARMWVLVEGGYSFAGSAAMTYAPADDPADARQFGVVHLPDLRVSGAMNRFAVAMTF